MKKALKILIITVCLVLTCVFVLSACDKKETMPADTEFELTFVSTNFVNLSDGTWKLATPMIFDTKESGIKLTKDGTATVTLMFNKGLAKIANKYLQLDLSDVLNSLNLTYMMNAYAKPIAPGFDASDIKTSMELLRSLNAELILDYEDERVIKLVKDLEENGKVGEGFEIPEKIGIRYCGKYEITHQPLVDGGEMTVIMLDEPVKNGESYLMLQMETLDDGKRQLKLCVDFLALKLLAVEKTDTPEA